MREEWIQNVAFFFFLPLFELYDEIFRAYSFT